MLALARYDLPLRLLTVWALAIALSLSLSMSPMAVLIHLRSVTPSAFPPCDYIAC